MIGAPITEVITETAAPRPMRMPLPGCGGSASPVGGCSTGLGNCMRPSSGRPPGAGSSCVRTESGHTANPLTVWNRTPARGAALAAEGAKVADSTAEAVAANTLIVTCLLDDTSVDEVLTGIDLADRDLVNLTTSTPAQARTRAQWARERGARYLDGGITAVPPPMIGAPEAGGYVFYSGSRDLYERHQEPPSSRVSARNCSACTSS